LVHCCNPTPCSAIWRVQRDVAGQFPLPPITVRQQLFLVVVKFLARLRREFEIGSLNDGVDRTSLLAEAAINALHHVDIVSYRAPCAVIAAWPGFDGDGLSWADGLAKLAGDAAL